MTYVTSTSSWVVLRLVTFGIEWRKGHFWRENSIHLAIVKVDSRADQPQNKLSLSSSSSPGGENSRQNTKKSYLTQKKDNHQELWGLWWQKESSNRLSFIISKRKNLILKSEMLSLITDGFPNQALFCFEWNWHSRANLKRKPRFMLILTDSF